jgi:polyhydroxyalkanoate synthesis regulator phasin
MNSDTLTQLLQKGFRVTLGATATLVEAIQDPQHRDANLSRLTSELSQLAEEWEVKGTTTEQEARSFVDRLWQQQQSATATAPAPSPAAGSPAMQQDLQSLTAEIAAMRAELERLRAQDNS